MADESPSPTDVVSESQAQREHVRLRRTLSYRLRTERRMTFPAIARALAAGTTDPATGERVVFEISPKTALGDYWHVLRENGYVIDHADVELRRAEELEKCEALEAAYWPAAIGNATTPGDPQAANVVLRAMRTRHSLFPGLTQVQVTGPGGGPLQVQVSIPDEALVEMVAAARERQNEAAPSMN